VANGLDLRRNGGELTGGGLGLGLDSTEPAVPKRTDLLSAPISDFSGKDKLRFLLASTLGGANFLGRRDATIKANTAQEEAKRKQDIKILETMIKGASAINGTKGFTQKLALRDSLAKQLDRIDPEAANSFRELADSPSVTEIVSTPALAEQFGGMQRVLSAFEGSDDEKSALKSDIVEQNRAGINDKILRLQSEFPTEVNLDLNDDGVATSAEAGVWVKRHHESKKIPDSLKLTPTEMEVFQFDEFEEDLASMFGVRTRKAITGAQEKGLIRATNKAGELVFATEEQLRSDPTLKPEPKAALIKQQFGGQKKDEALFNSLVERRDVLIEQASNASTQKNLAQQMRATAERVATGTGTETITDLKSFGGTVARLLVSDALGKKIQDTDKEEVLRSLNAQGVSALIRNEKQGQVSNAERATFQKSLPGLGTSQSGNIAMSHIIEAQATSKIEEAAFIDSVTNQVANGGRDSDIGANKAFSDYVNEIPRTKGDGENIRLVDDNQSLWRYYLNGRPSKWLFPGGEMTMKDIQAVAQQNNLTVREFLAIADRKGTIRGVIQ